ncbi:hypothetical protein AGMMS49983_15570 [Clostridia bacterium]|nr:hypothetical protein AGMMS49983_15570 [Clostridia bacterium]
MIYAEIQANAAYCEYQCWSRYINNVIKEEGTFVDKNMKNSLTLCKFIVLHGDKADDVDNARYPYHEQINAYIVISRYAYGGETGYPDLIPDHGMIYKSVPKELSDYGYIAFGSVALFNDEVTLFIMPQNGATEEQIEYVRNFISTEFNLVSGGLG